jgi:uncharacterized membrane protein (DUF373 family)
MIDKITGFLKRCEPQTIFRKFMQYIINVLVVYIILVLSIGLIRTLSGIKKFFINMPIGQTFNIVVTEILTFLVIIELFRSFIDYFEAHRFRLNTMIDPAIMFVIRELIVKLYDQQGINWQGLSGFGFLIVCLGIVRTLAVMFSPGEDDHQRMG